MKERLFSVTASDCEWSYRRGSGAGGQKRNKTSSAVRCVHRPSGAVGNAEDQRSQAQNKKLAFKRMAESKKFQRWLRIESARQSGELAKIEENVDRAMDPRNIKEEVKEGGRWVST